LLVFCNPGNPQGNVWREDELKKLVQLTSEHGCFLLIDEIYCDLVFNNLKHSSPINWSLSENIVVCRGFSKTLATQSWRVAYMISAASTIAQIMRIHDPIYICVPFLQHSVGRYLDVEYDDFKHHIHELCNLMQSNWKVLKPAIQQAFGWEAIDPDGSMYAMFKHHEKDDMAAVLNGLKKGIGVAPGNIFYKPGIGNTGYIRIHCGISLEKSKAIALTLQSSSHR